MSTGRDDEKAWAELVDTFHAEPEPDDGVRRWPAAEDVDPDDDSPYDVSDPYRPDPYGWEPYGEGSDTLEHPASGRRGDSSYAADRNGPSRQASGSEDHQSGYSDAEGDHFVPPVPPPIPRGDRITRWAWAGLLAPPPVLLLATITNWSPPDEFMMVLVGGFVVGFGTLVARMRGRNPHDPDNGAVV